MLLFGSLVSGGTRGKIVQIFMTSKTLHQIAHDNALTIPRIAKLLRASKIRFPNRKAQSLVTNRNIRIKDVLEDLSAFSGTTLQHERWVRLALKSELPGMGLKEVSNFLKWSGFSKHLAVLDSINLSFLKWTGAVDHLVTPGRLSDYRVYYAFENWQNELAGRLGITVSELDNLIVFDWEMHIRSR